MMGVETRADDGVFPAVECYLRVIPPETPPQSVRHKCVLLDHSCSAFASIANPFTARLLEFTRFKSSPACKVSEHWAVSPAGGDTKTISGLRHAAIGIFAFGLIVKNARITGSSPGGGYASVAASLNS